ncbi:MAG TPA: hypothetical protein QF468_14075 [Nitrospinota bacterium]|nr:hypothetical protein [Nitrospinota bacterium]|tara:strand:- start:1154 stop:1426 length:273 start_codon:yes stop_codon:yes gene_type:complete
MITIEIPINNETIKINVDDARQAVSFIKGLYKGDNGVSFETPNISTLATHKKKKFVQDKVKNIFDSLKNSEHNSGGDTGSSQARKGGKKL